MQTDDNYFPCLEEKWKMSYNADCCNDRACPVRVGDDRFHPCTRHIVFSEDTLWPL